MAEDRLAVEDEYDVGLDDEADVAPETELVSAARRVLDAMAGDEAEELSSALAAWTDLYLASDTEED